MTHFIPRPRLYIVQAASHLGELPLIVIFLAKIFVGLSVVERGAVPCEFLARAVGNVTQMGKLAGLGEHGVRNLAQGVETLNHGIEHDDQMLPDIKVFHIPFATVFTAEFNDF